MNNRERLLAVLHKGKADVPPWYADLSWWYGSRKQTSAQFKKTYEGERGYLQLFKDTGAGICFYAPPVWKAEYTGEVTLDTRTEGAQTFSCFNTPVGTLKSVSEFLPESFTSAIREHYIKRPEDLEIMRYIFTHRKVSSNYDEFKRIDALWDGQGLAVCLAPCCTAPLQTLLSRWAGVEKTVEILVEAPVELEETLRCMQEADDPIFEIIGDSPAPVVEFPDNLDGRITGNLIEQYELPYWQKRITQLHARQKIVGVHNDGGVRNTLPFLIEAGFDFAEAVTPAPVGDMAIEEIMSVAAGKIVVWGGLPGPLFARAYADNYFADFVRRVLKTFDSTPFVMGVADQVPPDSSFERICSVRRILEESH